MSTRYGLWAAAPVMLSLFLATSGHAQRVTTDKKTPQISTRDINAVTPQCQEAVNNYFIVSLNDDDDNNNNKKDLEERRPSAQENNLRQFNFPVGQARFVTLSEPVVPGARGAAAGKSKHVRAWRSDRQSRFLFNKSYPLPLTFYLEGTQKSKKRRDFEFSYTLINANGNAICAAKLIGTVVAANATFEVLGGNNATFKEHNKLLSTATGKAKRNWQPSHYEGIASDWRYPGAIDGSALARNQRAKQAYKTRKATTKARHKAEKKQRKRLKKHRAAVKKEAALAARQGRAPRVINPPAALAALPAFTPMSTELSSPGTKETDFFAGMTITPVRNRDQHELITSVEEAGLIIEAHIPINITAPLHAQEYGGWINGQSKFTPKPRRQVAGVPQFANNISSWHSANTGTLKLFSSKVDYHIEDQFRENIKTSAWGRRKIMVRENIVDVLSSPLPKVLEWIRDNLNETGLWKDKSNGEINDGLRFQGLPKERITQNAARGGKEFHPTLQMPGGILANLVGASHQWQVGIDGMRPFHTVTDNTFTASIFAKCDSRNNACGAPANKQVNRGIVIRIESDYNVVTP